jgi:hypothetical protein
LLGGIDAALGVVQAVFCFHYRSVRARRRALVVIGVLIEGRMLEGPGSVAVPLGKRQAAYFQTCDSVTNLWRGRAAELAGTARAREP